MWLVVASLLGAAAMAQELPPIAVNNLPTPLAGEWMFRIGHDPAFASPFRERRNWQRIRVPGSWRKQGYPDYNGHAWYRLSLFMSSELAGEDLGLDLGRIADVDEVFFNGRRIGTTGVFPPAFAPAFLARRFYAIPREAVRFGMDNELAIHVFSHLRSGGLVGPSPILDRLGDVLKSEVLRDIGAYSLATFLLTLAVFLLVLFMAQRDALELPSFAGFLVATSILMASYTSWGLAQAVGYAGSFRLHVAALLGACALLPAALFRLGRRPQPVAVVACETILALGAASALVWRDVGDLALWIAVGEIMILVVIGLVGHLAVTNLRRRRPWGPILVGGLGAMFVGVSVDILVDLGMLPRLRILGGEMLAPIGLVPCAIAATAALSYAWVERKWGEPLDPATGVMPRDRFTDRINGEMQRARRSGFPLTVAVLRLTTTDPTGESDTFVGRAISGLRRSLRQIDLLARFDQESFALFLAETEERAATTILERLRRTVNEGAGTGRARTRLTAGVAQYRAGRHLSADELLQEAEAALYAAISEGGDCTATAP
jgi:diguanylate cyclase (GGDEF)-like protein